MRRTKAKKTMTIKRAPDDEVLSSRLAETTGATGETFFVALRAAFFAISILSKTYPEFHCKGLITAQS